MLQQFQVEMELKDVVMNGKANTRYIYIKHQWSSYRDKIKSHRIAALPRTESLAEPRYIVL